MATTLFMRRQVADTHRAAFTVGEGGAGTERGWRILQWLTTRGASLATATANAVAGPTSGVCAFASSSGVEWISEPLSADATISGDITANIWASENNMSANVAINVAIYVVRATTRAKELIVRSTRVTELAVTTNAVNNFTTGMLAADYTDVLVNRGDRLLVVIFGDDAGTMASGFTFSIGFGGATAAANGDTFITFTENLTFESPSSTPAGTVIFPTNTASPVDTADNDLEMWTARGAGVQSITRTLADGETAGEQAGSGSTLYSWFTRPLQAVTLSGWVRGNIRISNTFNGSARVQIALVDNDGTNEVIWGDWPCSCVFNTLPPTSTGNEGGQLPGAQAAVLFMVSGDDLAIAAGQRLRFRVYWDDISDISLSAGDYTLHYAGTSGGASGDTFLTFPVTLAEQVATKAIPPVPASQFRDPYGLARRMQRVWWRLPRPIGVTDGLPLFDHRRR